MLAVEKTRVKPADLHGLCDADQMERWGPRGQTEWRGRRV